MRWAARLGLSGLSCIAWNVSDVAGQTCANLLALAEMVLRRMPDSAAHMPQCRTIPRWQLQQGIPARELRQGAYKQQLRDHEEAELELVSAQGGPCAVAADAGERHLGGAVCSCVRTWPVLAGKPPCATVGKRSRLPSCRGCVKLS